MLASSDSGNTTDPFAGEALTRSMALVAAVERLATTERLEDVIAVVRETARAISGADGVTFVLREGNLCHYVEEDAVGELWKGRRFPLASCVSGWCMRNRCTAVIGDIYADPRIPHEAYRPTFVKSMVMVPVGTGTPIAAIGSYWAERRDFDEGEIALLNALARSTSAAIEAIRVRETLRESEARLSMALTGGGLGAWELDLGSGRLSATPMCKDHFGHGAEAAFTYDDLAQGVHPDDRARQQDAFERATTARAPIGIECRSVGPDGTVRWIEIRGRTVLDEEERPVRLSGITRDVTERHEAKDRMDRLQSDLAHMGRLTEMGQMVSTMAHELRQPLTAASTYLSAAKRSLVQEKARDPHALEFIGKADGQLMRASQIILRICGFAGRTEPAKAPEDAGILIAEASELARLDPRHRDVDLRIEVAPELPLVLVDKVQVQQVLLNLLRNALEATDGCETRVVTVRARRADTGGDVEISVADTGPGLAPDVADRLFRPFVTTKSDGMGVGLAICRTIVDSHQGKMWARSEPGEGATFFFTVPGAEQG